MQAFIYHHLVPAQNLAAARVKRGRFKIPLTLLSSEPVKLPAGASVPLKILAASQVRR